MILQRQLILPNYIAGLAAWDADNPNNDLSNIPANSALIAAFNSVTNTSENFTQSSGSLKPVYAVAACGLHNALTFIGGQFMSATSKAYVTNAPMTVVALVRYTLPAVATQIILGRSSAAAGLKVGQNGSGNGYYSNINKGSYITTNTPVMFAANTWTVASYVFNGSNTYQFRKNGQPFQTLTTGTGSLGLTAALYLGCIIGNASFLTGQVQYIFYIPAILQPNVLSQLEQFLIRRLP